MEFKKGDLVECWDRKQSGTKGLYFAFNETHGAEFPHIVRMFENGNANTDVTLFRYCRHARPDLKIEDPVWVVVAGQILSGFQPRHFAGWNKLGEMLVFVNGRTSHSSSITGVQPVEAREYSLTKPEDE